MAALAPITMALHTVGTDGREAVAAEVRRGIASSPKRLPTRCFYDERGSDLFDEITRLPEYYLTRSEAWLLDRHAEDIIRRNLPESLVELGAGYCTKTRILIDAGRRLGCLNHLVPFDISEATLRDAAQTLVTAYPGLSVYGLVGDFSEHMGAIPRQGRQLIAFLGSTIGNFDPPERDAFLRTVRSLMAPDDLFLLGIDLVKDVGTLEAAYNDSQGVTAAFNLNLPRALNAQFGADFDVDGFAHRAFFVPELSRIEMHLLSLREQRVRIADLGLEVGFARGELVLTEISTKFTRDSMEGCLAAAGLGLQAWMTDPGDHFALLLAGPV